MTYYTFRWPLFLILLVVGGYFLAHFFGTLAGINTFAAIAWSFGSGAAGMSSSRVTNARLGPRIAAQYT